MPSWNLTSVSGVQAYIHANHSQYKFNQVVMLSGGNTNFVYRLYLDPPAPIQGRLYETLIVKHATSYAALDTSFAIPLERQEIEVQALRYAGQVINKDSVVSVPLVFDFDKSNGAVIMSDAGVGSKTLKELMLHDELPPYLAQPLGAALGEFLGRLHSRGRTSQDRDAFSTNTWGRQISTYMTHARVLSTLESHVISPATLVKHREEITAATNEMSHLIQTSNETIIMGDFWTGNIMIQLGVSTETAQQVLEKVTVVDWEVAKCGIAGNDVGQYAAEMILLANFIPNCQPIVAKAMQAFCEEYRKTYDGFYDDLIATAAMQIGSHLIVITPGYGPWNLNADLMRTTISEGIDYLISGQSRDTMWLRECTLKGFYKE